MSCMYVYVYIYIYVCSFPKGSELWGSSEAWQCGMVIQMGNGVSLVTLVISSWLALLCDHHNVNTVHHRQGWLSNLKLSLFQYYRIIVLVLISIVIVRIFIAILLVIQLFDIVQGTQWLLFLVGWVYGKGWWPGTFRGLFLDVTRNSWCSQHALGMYTLCCAWIY